jgi:hypothetical protein
MLHYIKECVEMTNITLAEASKLTGKNPSTITRAVNKGKLSCRVDGDGVRLFDASELERAFGKLRPVHDDDGVVRTSANALESIRLHGEVKRLHEREIALVREQMRLVASQLDDVRQDRDHWRQQAERSTLMLEDMRQKDAATVSEPPKKKSWWRF